MTKTPTQIVEAAAAAKAASATALASGNGGADYAWLDESPWLEVVAGVRALGPLIAFLYVVLKYGLQEELPLVRASIRRRDGTENAIVLSVYPGLVLSFLGIVVFNLG